MQIAKQLRKKSFFKKKDGKQIRKSITIRKEKKDPVKMDLKIIKS